MHCEIKLTRKANKFTVKRNKMKEKTGLLIMAGYQVALGVIMLALATIWIGYHLFAGNFNLVGFLVAALVWYIVFYLTKLSVIDYRKEKANK